MTLANESPEQHDHLIIHNPDGSVSKIPIPEQAGAELRAGRELDNDVTLADPRVSRHHAKIRRVSEDLLEISDVGSANGTIVGAVLIDVDKWHRFSPGQVAQIGDTRLVWEQSATTQSTVEMVPISGPEIGPPFAQPAKKSSSFLPWLAGLGVLAVVGLLIWVILGLNQPTPPEVAGVTPGSNTPADISRQTPQGAAANVGGTPTHPPETTTTGATTDGSSPLATPSLPLAPAQPSIMIESIEFLPVISGALFDTSHVYLIVKVRVENLGDTPFAVSPGQFEARSAAGEVLEEFGQHFAASEFSRLGVIDRFEDLTLGSGGSVAEELIFFLETRPYQLGLTYRPAGLEPLQVSLGTLSAGQELSAILGTPTAEPTEVLAAAETTATSPPTPEPATSATSPPPRADGFSRTIPTGSLVGTIAFPDFDGATYHLYFGNVASGEVNLWRNESSQPMFSHSGDRIAYHSWAEKSRGLITSNLDHSNGFLVGTFLEDQLPTWSPDDEKLLFLSRRTGTRQSQLYKAASNQERPEAQFILEGEYPTWHRNGVVVFKGWVTSGVGLQVASGEVTDFESLTDNDTDTAASISPDGKRVAFMSRREENWDIYLVNIDGSGLTRLTSDAADDGLPTWSPDGKAIAFVSNRGGPWAIWAMTPRGTGIRQLFTMQGSPDGFVFSEPTTDTTRGWAEERISWTQN